MKSSGQRLWELSTTPPVAGFLGKVAQCITKHQLVTKVASRLSRVAVASRCVYHDPHNPEIGARIEQKFHLIGHATDQSSTSVDGGAPGLAVDGNENTVFGPNSCTHTGPEAQPWWSVDLEFTELVTKVRILNRDSFGKWNTHRPNRWLQILITCISKQYALKLIVGY